MSNIFFTSDTHFGHKNIASKNGSQWKEGWRPYKSLKEHDEAIVKGINQVVGEDDILYHLGDWSFGGKENIWNFRKQLRCSNIHLILGNHDHHIENNILLPGDNDFGVCAQDLFSSVSHYKEVKIGQDIFVLFHYGMRVWHGSHKGWIHLYAHSHDSLPPLGKSHDVGVDAAIRLLGAPKPFHLSQIKAIVDQQQISYTDHHEQSTNTGKPPK